MENPEFQIDKAYKNIGFLDSRDGRPMRILAEYLGTRIPFSAFPGERHNRLFRFRTHSF